MKHAALLAIVVVLTGCTAQTHRLAKVYDAAGGHGTAFAIGIDGDDYVCVTAQHVTSRPEGTGLASNGFPVEVVKLHPFRDVAILRVPRAAGELTVYRMGEAELGPAMAVGFGGISITQTETRGRVISIRSGDNSLSILCDLRVIQGMSGGPLLQGGKVIGIVVGFPPGIGSQVPHLGLSWYEPISTAMDLLKGAE